MPQNDKKIALLLLLALDLRPGKQHVYITLDHGNVHILEKIKIYAVNRSFFSQKTKIFSLKDNEVFEEKDKNEKLIWKSI